MGMYFSARVQKTMVNGKVSPCDYITWHLTGLYIRDPLLFSLYTNDLPDYLDMANVSLYADNMFMNHGSQVDLICTLRMELNTVSEWLPATHLTPQCSNDQIYEFSTRPKLLEFSGHH